MQNIADIRKEYRLQTLNEEDVAADAFEQFKRWWEEAVNSYIEEVNAMTLATVSKSGLPSARIVLMKGFDKNGFVFYTNYNSHKANDLEDNPYAALIFFWKELERQIRIEGRVEKVSGEESDIYFKTRPAGSRISAWASPQSEVVQNREVLEENVKRYIRELRDEIPRPPYWGGYRVKPSLIEFWQGRSNRLHDRIQYNPRDNGEWKIVRLAP